MNAIELAPVRSRRERRRFLTFPWAIYRDDPMWVPPLLPEREKALDPARGAFFARGEAEPFVVLKEGRLVGTICMAEDQTLNRRTGRREAIFGFFETVDDDKVADALIGHALAWTRARGLDTLSGPFNLDYEDGYGVLVEGRDRRPAMLCGHTPPYYQRMLEERGFGPLRGDNLAYGMELDLDSEPLKRAGRLAERIRRRGWITLRTPELDRWMDEVEVVQDLLNRSTAHIPDFRPWEREAVASLLEPFKEIADPELVLFAQIDGRTVGWFPGVPDMNEVIVHLNGLRRPWDRLRALPWLRYRPKSLTVKSVLLLPEYWGSGVAPLLFHEMAVRAVERGFRWVDLSLTSADNPYTPQLAERMGARVYKRYRVYTRTVAS